LSYSGNSDSASIGNENFNTVAAVGVKINIPLDTGGEIYHTMKQAAVERANSELEYKKAEKQISLGLSSAVSSYKSLVETLKANREAVRLASLSFTNTRERFRSGKATLSELNDSEILLTSQKLEETLSLYRIHTSMAKIRQFSSQVEDL
jgi:outer membrane protein TolC